jgi:hypothetical protein
MKNQLVLKLSPIQEAFVETSYKASILAKQKELKELEKKTKKVQKYTAKYYVEKTVTIILAKDWNQTQNAILANAEHLPSLDTSVSFGLQSQVSKLGSLYYIDSDLTDEVLNFINVWNVDNNKVMITIRSFDRNGLSYEANGRPVIIEAINEQGSILVRNELEIFDKFDLYCF